MGKPKAESRARIHAALEAEGIEVRGIARIEPSLEDVFVAHVRRSGGVAEG